MSTQDDLSAIIGKIVQNPEFADMVSSIKGESKNDNRENITNEMMSKLPDVLAMVSPMLEGNYEKNDADSAKGKGSDASVSDKAAPLKKYDKGKAERLLNALKPYLRSERCDIIDKCVSMMQLTDVMGVLQGLDGLSSSSKKDGGEGDLHT